MEGTSFNNLERILEDLFLSPNRPLVNFLQLRHVMSLNRYGEEIEENYSMLLRSCFFFYYKVFCNHEMFEF